MWERSAATCESVGRGKGWLAGCSSMTPGRTSSGRSLNIDQRRISRRSDKLEGTSLCVWVDVLCYGCDIPDHSRPETESESDIENERRDEDDRRSRGIEE